MSSNGNDTNSHKFFRTQRKDEARRRTVEAGRRGQSVGVVMTMGALHAGHLSLVERSVRECDWTAVTIFVNPTQFGPNEDFARYPRQLDKDIDLLASSGVDLVFTPEADGMYRPGHSTFIEPPEVGRLWEGQCRPGHFRGVTTIVLKLLQILPADVAFFGQKDYQQYLVLRTMADELDLAVDVRMCPIVREPDGLAMSSRNQYLSTEQRQRALSIWKSLEQVQQWIREGERRASTLASRVRTQLIAGGINRIDYVAMADPTTLLEVREVDRPAVVAIAAFVDQVRLIDNVIIDPAGGV